MNIDFDLYYCTLTVKQINTHFDLYYFDSKTSKYTFLP